MNLWLPIGILALASLFGFYWRSQQGKLKAASQGLNSVSNEELSKIVRAKSSFMVNSDLNEKHQLQLGKSVTLLQFSTAFCSPCKATAQIISHLVEGMDDVV